jgi:hypothetical protein
MVTLGVLSETQLAVKLTFYKYIHTYIHKHTHTSLLHDITPTSEVAVKLTLIRTIRLRIQRL